VGRDGISFSDEPIRAEVAEARAGTLHLFRNHPRPETPVDLVELADRYLQLNSDDTELKTVRDSLAAPAQSARSHAPTCARLPSGTSKRHGGVTASISRFGTWAKPWAAMRRVVWAAERWVRHVSPPTRRARRYWSWDRGTLGTLPYTTFLHRPVTCVRQRGLSSRARRSRSCSR
jgi:hypothetical protein